MLNSKKYRFLVVVLWALAGVSVFIGCGDESTPTSPSSPNNSSRAAKAPLPVVTQEAPFQREVWEAVYASPFVLQGNNSSWTFLSQEITTVGSYAGVNSASEPFTLDVTDVDYYSTADLLALDEDGSQAATINQLNLTLSHTTGTYTGPSGSVELFGVVRSYDKNGTRYHYFAPHAYDAPPPFQRLFPAVDAKSLIWKTANSAGVPVQGVAKDQACVDNCIANSGQPRKPTVTCPPDKIMDATCKAKCDAAWDTAITNAIKAGCEGLCKAIDDYDKAVGRCKEGATIGWVGGLGAVVAGSTGVGLIAVIIADGAILAGTKICLDNAKEDYDEDVGEARSGYNFAVATAKSNYTTCAEKCCRPPTEEEILDIITGN